MAQFSRKPLVVEAIQLPGSFALLDADGAIAQKGAAGDWLVTYENGAQQIAAPEQFEATFEPYVAPRTRRAVAAGGEGIEPVVTEDPTPAKAKKQKEA